MRNHEIINTALFVELSQMAMNLYTIMQHYNNNPETDQIASDLFNAADYIGRAIRLIEVTLPDEQ